MESSRTRMGRKGEWRKGNVIKGQNASKSRKQHAAHTKFALGEKQNTEVFAKHSSVITFTSKLCDLSHSREWVWYHSLGNGKGMIVPQGASLYPCGQYVSLKCQQKRFLADNACRMTPTLTPLWHPFPSLAKMLQNANVIVIFVEMRQHPANSPPPLLRQFN